MVKFRKSQFRAFLEYYSFCFSRTLCKKIEEKDSDSIVFQEVLHTTKGTVPTRSTSYNQGYRNQGYLPGTMVDYFNETECATDGKFSLNH